MAGISIDVNSMTKTYANFAKCYGPQKSQVSGSKFADVVLGKLEEAERTEAVSTKDMTMEEYKQYIYDKIAQIPVHPSQSGWQWHVEITDSGFEAMKNDPEYEAQVLSAIRANFSFRDPYQSWNYSVLHFGASEEESYGQSFGGGSRVFHEKEETYWERRQKRRKRRQEELLEIQEKKAAARRFAQEKYDMKIAQIRADPEISGMDLQSPDLTAAYEAAIFADLIARNHFEV